MSKSNNVFFPDVSTEELAKKACRQAAYAAWFVAAITGALAVLAMAGVGFVGAFGVDSWAVLDSALFVVLGFGVFKHSRVAAVLLLGIYVAERLFSGPPGGVVMTILFTAIFVSGVRGAFSLEALR